MICAKPKKLMNSERLSKKLLPLPLLIVSLMMLAGFMPLAAALVPVNLQCEYRVNPLGIEVAQPRLFWQVQSKERDQGQSACQILVASSEGLAISDHGDLWDSGRIATNGTINLLYAGKPLVSGEQCFWKVRVWDQHGQPSAWSKPGTWSMGLLEPKDWQGKWIGWDHGASTDPLAGAKWIWFPEGNPADSAPVATRYFRRIF